MEERVWAYRRRQPEETVLYEAVRDNLATLLAEASELGRGLPRCVLGEAGVAARALPAVDAVLSAPGTLQSQTSATSSAAPSLAFRGSASSRMITLV